MKDLLKSIWSTLNRWFCTPEPVDGIALFRILLGILLVTNAGLELPDSLHYFSSQGILEAGKPNAFFPVNLFYFTGNSKEWIHAWMTVQIVSSIFVAAGLFTRTSALVAWATLCSFQHENWQILNSGDVMLHLLVFLLIFTPSGNTLSIDSWWADRIGKPKPKLAWAWGQRLIQFQVAYLYLSAFIFKSQGDSWASGYATYYTSRLWSFGRLDLPLIFDHLWTIQLLTWGTLLVEFALGTLIWIPSLRVPVIIAGVALHLGIEWTMNIPVFEWVMMAGLVAMLEPYQGKILVDWLCKDYKVLGKK